MTEILTPGAGAPLSAVEADLRLRAALEAAERATRSAVLLFLEIARRRLYRELGSPSMLHYATEGLKLSASRARYFLKLARDLEDLPAIREALAAGQIGWTRAVQVARVATPETETAWLGEAKRCGRRELEGKIKEARGRTRGQAGVGVAGAGAATVELPLLPVPAGEAAARPLPAAAVDVTFHLSAEQYARFTALQEKLRKSRVVPQGWSREEVLLAGYEELLGSEPASCEAAHNGHADALSCEPAHKETADADGRPVPHPHWHVVVHRCEECGRASVAGSDGEPKTLSQAEAERVACDSVIVQRDGTRKSSIPPCVRRQVMNRDGHRCARCGATRFLEVHHRIARADGGGNEPENLVTLCSACHQMEHLRPGGVLGGDRARAGPPRAYG